MGNELLKQIRDEMEREYRPPETDGRDEPAEADDSSSTELTALRSMLSTLHASYALVGQLPPEPPTFRGRMGARLVKLVQRMLFWYTPQIVHFQYSVLRALEEQANILQSAKRRIVRLEIELEKERAENQDLRRVPDGLKRTMRMNPDTGAAGRADEADTRLRRGAADCEY
jgi:hypothetical protein